MPLLQPRTEVVKALSSPLIILRIISVLEVLAAFSTGVHPTHPFRQGTTGLYHQVTRAACVAGPPCPYKEGVVRM